MRIAAAALLVAIALPAAADVTFQKLTLVSQTTVAHNMVILGDIVRSCPPSLMRIKIMPSPEWGSTTVVPKEDVLKRIYQASRQRVWLGGADAVRIIRPGGDRALEIAGQLRRALDVKVAAYEGLGYEMRFPDRTIMLPPGPLRVECEFPETLEGYRVVRLRVRMARGLVRSLNVACRFSREVRVPLTAHGLERGDTLHFAGVQWEERTFSGPVPRCLDEADDASQFRLRRTVSAGTLITESIVERHPDVIAGQEVDLVLQRATVRVTARARALQTGWVGSRIRVQNLVDKRYVFARVASKGVVIHE